MTIETHENISLSNYTLYRIGGKAAFFVEIAGQEELKEAIIFAKERGLPFFVLGGGSNVLVSDGGFQGLVLRFTKGRADVGDNRIISSPDVMMAQVVTKTMQAGLKGLEWAIGIPGTLGGSVRGNAGCFGGEIKDVVHQVRLINANTLESKELTNTECQFGYRDSIFKKHPEWIIESVTLLLEKGNSVEIQENIRSISVERARRQDIGTKSCGCIFKNVSWARKDIPKEELIRLFPILAQFADRPSIPASFLIDRTGLKGTRVGRVVISPKHANYFVNEGGASAEEVVMLIAMTKDRVRREYGIVLEEEIQYVGF